MKKFVLLVVVVFALTTFFGCGKKKKDESAMDGLNGVASENVVSVTDTAAGNGGVVTGQVSDVPVVVENAENTAKFIK